MLLAAGAALGLGALNEMVEFIATLAQHSAHAGGYWNTGWDLIANFTGPRPPASSSPGSRRVRHDQLEHRREDRPGRALAAAVFRFTWGTPVYGLCERVVLGLGMCWISVLATRALTRPPGRARWRT